MVATKSVPLFITCVSCGGGIPFADGLDFVEVPVSLLNGVANPLIVQISGSSMEPFYFSGDLILIDLDREPTNTDIVLIFLNGEYFLKRIEFKNGKITLASTNFLFPKIILREYDQWQIIGVCVKKLELQRKNAKVFLAS
jgi:phage repressor protein C with HTH and peptisase S24 domain